MSIEIYELGSATRITKSRRFILGGVAVTLPRSDRPRIALSGFVSIYQAPTRADLARNTGVRFVFCFEVIVFINPQCCRILKCNDQSRNSQR
jgi:hypothetical protein